MNYSIVYCMTIGLSLLMTPVLIALAHRWKMYDRDDARKVHTHQIPRIGGVAIVMSMVAAIGIALYWFPALKPMLARERTVMICLGCASLMMFLLGLVDDIFHLNAWVKLLVQFSAAWIVCLSGVRFETLFVSHDWVVHLGWFSWPFTIVWILGITNAMNLIDGLDGLAGGIAMIAASAIAIFCFWNQQLVIMLGMLGILGSLTGFLFFNCHPARIFMGDSGSLFLGFTLSISTVVCVWQTQKISALTVTILALGIPIFDTLFSIMRRALERRSLFSPDRSHIHHCLLDRGLSQKQVTGFLCFISLSLGGLGLLTIIAEGWNLVVITICLLGLYVQVFHGVGAVRLREISSRLQTNRIIMLTTRQNRSEFEQARLLVSRAQDFDQWWSALQKAVVAMGGVWVEMNIYKNKCKMRTFRWADPAHNIVNSRLIQADFPLQLPLSGFQVRLTLALTLVDSLETAAHRIALMSRLVDEFGLNHLSWSEVHDQILSVSMSPEDIRHSTNDLIQAEVLCDAT